MKIIFPQVINAVLRAIRKRNQSFGNLYSKKSVKCNLVECTIQEIVDFPVLCLAQRKRKKSLFYLLICKIYGRFYRTFRSALLRYLCISSGL